MCGRVHSQSSANLAGRVHAVLDDGALDLGRELEQAERNADLVVVVEFAGLDAVAAAQDRCGEQLGRGLADIAGDADDLGRGERGAPRCGGALQCLEGVIGAEDGCAIERGRVGGLASEQHARGAVRNGLGGEVVAIVVLAGQRDEQIAGGGGARVDDRAAEGGVRTSAGEQRFAERGCDEIGVEDGSALDLRGRHRDCTTD